MGEEFPFDELEKVNKYIGDLTSENLAQAEQAIGKINDSLSGKSSPLRLVFESNGTISFENNQTPIKFGSENKLYSDYMKEKYEEFKKLTGDSIEKQATSKEAEIAKEKEINGLLDAQNESYNR
jgi:hypothetical protein